MTIRSPIMLLIRSLGVGGAERQIIALANQLAERGEAVVVATFYCGGGLEGTLNSKRVSRIVLGKHGRWDFTFPFRLALAIRRVRPWLIYSFMPGANIASALVRPFVTPPVVWGIRSSYMPLERYGFVSMIVGWFEGALAHMPRMTIYNSVAGLRHYVSKGYPEQNSYIVQNGIDINLYRRVEEGGRRVRNEIGVADNEILVGLVGRIDPVKNIGKFIDAAQQAAQVDRRLRFVLVGDGNVELVKSLRQQARMAGLDDRLTWLGVRQDMPEVYSALDISCSMSMGEGFSNVLAESMACEVPCIASDVGDARILLGNCGIILQSVTPQVMAEAIISMAALSVDARQIMGKACRQRIVANFSVSTMVDNTLSLLRSVSS